MPGPPPSTLTSALHTKGDMQVRERIIECLSFTSNQQVQSCLWNFTSWLVVMLNYLPFFLIFREFSSSPHSVHRYVLCCPLTLCLHCAWVCFLNESSAFVTVTYTSTFRATGSYGNSLCLTRWLTQEPPLTEWLAPTRENCHHLIS